MSGDTRTIFERAITKTTQFSDLNATEQKWILDQRSIIFQGIKTNLRELLSPLSKVDLNEIVTSDVLIKISRNEEIVVGRKVECLTGIDEYLYIPRFFRKSNTYDNEIFSENILSQLDSYHHQDVVTIGDISGAGKSTLLTSLANTIKKERPNLWILKIDLNNYAEFFWKVKKSSVKSITLLDLLNSRTESKLTNDLERKIFSIPDKVIILLDGVDELYRDYKSAILEIIRDCQSRSANDYYIKRTINLLVLSGSINLEQEMDLEISHRLKPFTEKDQVLLLQRYWGQKFQLSDDEKKKCKVYAEAVIQEWFKSEEKLVGKPLLTRMIAEILESRDNFEDGVLEWNGCYDFLMSGDVKPTLPKKFTLTELYQLYIYKNCSGNAKCRLNSLRSDIDSINLNCEGFLQILALKTVLDQQRCEYFSCYRASVKEIPNEKLRKFCILKKVDHELQFIHRSFAEYFLAECISKELLAHPDEQFLGFFFEEFLVEERFKIARKFFDTFLTTEVLPKEKLTALENYLKEENFNFLLYTSMIEGLLGILKFLLECLKTADVSVDINSITVKGNCGIHCAAEEGDYLMVKYLIEKNCSVLDLRNREDCTLLHLAAKSGSLETVKFLVEKGLEVDSKDGKGRTALHRATKKGGLELVKFLLEYGAYVNSRTKWGYTALHIAAGLGDLDKVKLLVENGAAIDYRGNPSGMVISTAVLGGNVDVVKYLVGKGADVMVRNRSGGTMLHLLPKWKDGTCVQEVIEMSKFLIARGVDINSVNDYGETVLLTAVKRGYKTDFIKYLVEQGVDINVINNYNETALSNAIKGNHIDVIRYLVENGAQFNVNHNQGDAVYEAVNYHYYEVVKYLGEKGILVNTTNDMGHSTLLCAVSNDDLEMVKILIENGAKINGTEILKDTLDKCSVDLVKYLVELGAKTDIEFEEVSNRNLEAIELLFEKGSKFKTFKDVGDNLELLRFLFDKGINVNTTEIFLNAAERGYLDIVKFLLEKGVDANVRTEFGSSPLYWAAKCNHVHVLKHLLRQGADVNAKDSNGDTPLYMAARQGCLEIVKILVEEGADLKNASSENGSLLREVIYMGYTEMVKYLVEQGAPLYSKSESALSAAFTYEKFDIVEFLLCRNADFTWSYENIVKQLMPSDCEQDEEKLIDVFGNVQILKYLLGKGVEVDSKVMNKQGILFNAVEKSDFKMVKYLIGKGCDVNTRNYYGRSHLHEAFDLNIVKLLVENGADVNAKDEYGYSVLCRAVDKSNFNICKYLVENGANLEEEDEIGQTLLHMKIYDYGDLSVDKIKYLIEKGVAFKLTKNGRSVLHDMIATSHIDLDLIKYVIKRGVDVNCQDNSGVTPLDEAVIAGDLDVVRLLIEKGAEIDKVKDVILFRAVKSYHHGNWENSLDMVKFLVQAGANLHARDKNGNTLLHRAIEETRMEIVKYLVEAGADINAMDQNGNSPLHVACGCRNLSLFEYLIEKGELLQAINSKGRTLLHEAALNGSFGMVKILVERGSDVNASDRDGQTPLHDISRSSASFFGINEVLNTAKFLIEKGAKVDMKSRKGRTPLHEASANKELDLLKLFIENGADVNARDEYGRTALFSLILATKDGFRDSDKEIVDFLYRSGADLGHRADNQRTALHEASILGILELVELLVRLGADVNAKTKAGRTALHDAARRGQLEVVEFLVKTGAEVEGKTTQGTTALDEAIKGQHDDVVEFLKKESAEALVVEK